MPACLLSKFFFQFTFAATASTLVSGALAERCNFIAYLVYCNLITGRYTSCPQCVTLVYGIVASCRSHLPSAGPLVLAS